MQAAGVPAPLRFTAALTDGARLWAFRWASDGRPATLYWRQDAAGLVVVSEPIDDAADGWNAVPSGCTLVARAGRRGAARADGVPGAGGMTGRVSPKRTAWPPIRSRRCALGLQP